MRIMLAAVLAIGCSSSPVSRSVGARCTVSADCDQRCLPAPDWPGGFCTIACDTDSQCPAGAHCIHEAGGVCAFACVTDADCRFLVDSYTCSSVDAQAGGKVSVCHG